MNSLRTKNAMKINGLISTKAAVAALLLSAFSSFAFADRPAMEENRPMMTEPAATQAAPENIQPRPQAEMPSAVEGMMQRQHQQHTGDVLQLPAKEIQPGETIKIKLLDQPRRGMSMAKVQQEFGQPMATSESVGKPPITSWTYNDRIVYFEYSTVLHVVAR
jgi:hypothetical protein